nr:MAG TPA: hypothetical protein [Caudoviricetes sp.]
MVIYFATINRINQQTTQIKHFRVLFDGFNQLVKFYRVRYTGIRGQARHLPRIVFNLNDWKVLCCHIVTIKVVRPIFFA